MRGIEVSIVGAGKTGANVRVRIAPPGFLGEGREWPLDTRVMNAPGANPVRAVGKRLLGRLQEANKEISDAIDALLKLSPSELNPLYLRITDEQAATLPWETLYANDDFITLQPSWQIARISEPTSRLTNPEFVATSQIRIVAVLSALRRPALDEWAALRNAATAARVGPGGLDVRLTVLVGEPSLKKQIDSDIAAGCDFVSVSTVPGSVDELMNRIGAIEPQLLHMYCHGSVRGTSRRLHFGTPLEWMAGEKETGSLNVGIPPLAKLALDTKAWLVVINACEGGAGTGEVYSLADELARQGVPAAIGHRQPISANFAHEFAERLYPSLFRLIAREIAVGGDREIEWAEALYAPRSGFAGGQHGSPEVCELWSLPILHVRDYPFRVRIVSPGDARAAAVASAEIGTKETLAEAIRTVAGLDAPREVVDELLEPLPPGLAAQIRAPTEPGQSQ